MASTPAIRNAAVYPRTAPRVPNPKKTSRGAKKVLMEDRQIDIRLVYSNLSKPANVEDATLRRAPAKMVIDTIFIKGSISGLENTVVAKKGARKKETIDKRKPTTVVKNKVEARTFLTSAVLFSDLY